MRKQAAAITPPEATVPKYSQADLDAAKYSASEGGYSKGLFDGKRAVMHQMAPVETSTHFEKAVNEMAAVGERQLNRKLEMKPSPPKRAGPIDIQAEDHVDHKRVLQSSVWEDFGNYAICAVSIVCIGWSLFFIVDALIALHPIAQDVINWLVDASAELIQTAWAALNEI
ncbi:MAG: hypothetical protein ABI612_06145 [Betaproteobacteria bacterium]